MYSHIHKPSDAGLDCISSCDRIIHTLPDDHLRRCYQVSLEEFPVVTDPAVQPALRAAFMRPTDWVIAVRLAGQARVYPAWLLDNIHALNDCLGGVHITVMHCEICSSSVAYLSDYDDQRLIFGTGGLHGGTLAVRDVNSGSLWSHGQGLGLDGAFAGHQLAMIQSFQCSYQEWLRLEPDSTVVVWPEPASHPDARHGHGSEVSFAQRGMDPTAAETMWTGNDSRLPENEIVTTLNMGGHALTIPLGLLRKAGGVMQHRLGAMQCVTILHGYDSSFTGTYQCLEDGRQLEFFAQAWGEIRDRQTGSCWDVLGRCIEGALAGAALTPVPAMMSKWHSLACYLPDIELARLAQELVRPAPGKLRELLHALSAAGIRVTNADVLFFLSLPDGAEEGVSVRLNDAPCQLLCFTEIETAQDYLHEHAFQAGTVLLSEDPPLFDDELGTRKIPYAQRAWSGISRHPLVRQTLNDAVQSPGIASRPNLTALARGLSIAGYPVVRVEPCWRDGIPPAAVNGWFVKIAGEPFMVYAFSSDREAAGCTAGRPYTLQAGRFILRSDPADTYRLPFPRGTKRRPDHEVSWSPLLSDKRFRKALQNVSKTLERKPTA